MEQRSTPLQFIRGVGPKRAEAFAKSGLLSVRDLLFYFPRGYISRKTGFTIRALADKLRSPDFLSSDVDQSLISKEISIAAHILSKREIQHGSKKSMLIMKIDDGSGQTADLVFWNRIQFFERVFLDGQFVLVSGVPSYDEKYRRVAFHHPEIIALDSEDEELLQGGSLLPKYTITQDMSAVGISIRLLRQLIGQNFDDDIALIDETLSFSLIEKKKLLPLKDAIRHLHFPADEAMLTRAKNRMKFEELFYFELILALRAHGLKNSDMAPALQKKSTRARSLVERLPFELTKAQVRVINEIANDLEKPQSMNRLLQGDVGSGKTIVAVLMMLMAIDSGYQTVLMAPTEILAEQHFHSIKKLLEGIDVNVVQLVGGQKKLARNNTLDDIASGKANIIVGTHALFGGQSKKTIDESLLKYHKVGLVVIDEQHRFGVAQRAKLREFGKQSFVNAGEEPRVPHILVMSATPIPRTLSMTLYGDLDVSTIDELPANRKPIQTRVVFESSLPETHHFIREQVRAGRQAFIVYPLVDKSEKLELKSAVEQFEFISREVFPDLKCGMIHGQMFWYEKEEAMTSFKNREFDILVATTVVEVGLDIPNASVMLIEHAERFGLSQLHQLRGRVGRGADQSFCFLATKDHFKFLLNRGEKDQSERLSAITRLRTMERTTDGFEIARVDLKLRGPGDMFGTKQSGLPDFKYTDLIGDEAIISLARHEAFDMIAQDPHLRKPENAIIRDSLRIRYRDSFGMIEVA